MGHCDLHLRVEGSIATYIAGNRFPMIEQECVTELEINFISCPQYYNIPSSSSGLKRGTGRFFFFFFFLASEALCVGFEGWESCFIRLHWERCHSCVHISQLKFKIPGVTQRNNWQLDGN